MIKLIIYRPSVLDNCIINNSSVHRWSPDSSEMCPVHGVVSPVCSVEIEFSPSYRIMSIEVQSV